MSTRIAESILEDSLIGLIHALFILNPDEWQGWESQARSLEAEKYPERYAEDS